MSRKSLLNKNGFLNTVLLIIIAFLLLILITGTIVGVSNFIKRNKTPEVLISQGKAVNLAAPVNSDETEYYQLGTIRIICMAEKNAKSEEDFGDVFVISPWLSYPIGDTVFYEEIARKQLVLKGIFSQYFSEKTQTQILSLGEEIIVKELVEKINAQLSLGKVSSIFFTDFIFI